MPSLHTAGHPPSTLPSHRATASTRDVFSALTAEIWVHAPVYVSLLCMKSVRQSIRVIFLNIK